MYIGFCLRGHLSGRSGGFLYDRMVIAGLQDRGHDVSIITLPWAWSYPRQLLTNVTRWPVDRLGRADFDVLVQDELAHPALPLVNTRLSSRVTYPIVSLVHLLRTRASAGRLDKRWSRWIEKRYLSTVDGVIINSRATQSAVRDLASPAYEQLAYPGKDRLVGKFSTDTSPIDTDPDTVHLLYVGNVIPRKGLATLVRGLARLDSGWHLAIVGDTGADSAYVHRVRRTIDRYSLDDRIDWTGPIADDALAAAYRSADVLAMPSRYEAFGIVYVEAMGFETIPLASTAGAGPELITDGVDGLLVPPDDPEAIADRISVVADDLDRRRTLKHGARARYEDFPTWEETVERVCTFLEAMAECR